MGKKSDCMGRRTHLERYVLTAYGLHVRVFFFIIRHTNKCPLLTPVIIILFSRGFYLFYHCNYTLCQQLFLKTETFADSVECFKD
jgi:hypothetical protein